MPKGYRPYLPDQDLLLPPSLREWVAEEHLVYFVSDVVDQLDLSGIHVVYGEEKRGQPPYDPRLMTKLLVYAHCTGVFSSRRIQKRLQEDIPFKVLAAGNEPDFRTISDFRKIHIGTLQGLFEQVLEMALEVGAVKVGRVALDGTKVKANASKHKAMSYGRMKEKQKQLREEVKQLLEQAEAADEEEDSRHGSQRGDELPEELRRRETRLAKIQWAKKAPTVNPGFGFLTPPPPPVHAALRLPESCGFRMVFRICPRLTDRPPVCVPPPGSPDCGVRAGPPARGSLPMAGSTAALTSPPPPALFVSARCAVSRSAPAFVCRPMSPTPKSARNNSPHPPPRGVAAGRPLLAPR